MGLAFKQVAKSAEDSGVSFREYSKSRGKNVSMKVLSQQND